MLHINTENSCGQHRKLKIVIKSLENEIKEHEIQNQEMQLQVQQSKIERKDQQKQVYKTSDQIQRELHFQENVTSQLEVQKKVMENQLKSIQNESIHYKEALQTQDCVLEQLEKMAQEREEMNNIKSKMFEDQMKKLKIVIKTLERGNKPPNETK